MGDFHGEAGSLSFMVRQAWLSIRSAIEVDLRSHGLSVPQYATLFALEKEAGCSVADIGRAVSSSRQAANELIGGLEREGLIERRPHPTDRRTHELRLTEKGRRRLEEARPAVARREAELESGFSEEQLRSVRSWLTRMTQS